MHWLFRYSTQSSSLPSRERGLKSADALLFQVHSQVAPLAGAWIEIRTSPYSTARRGVAPLAGAWIEMQIMRTAVHDRLYVAPLAGAWIEMYIIRIEIGGRT